MNGSPNPQPSATLNIRWKIESSDNSPSSQFQNCFRYFQFLEFVASRIQILEFSKFSLESQHICSIWNFAPESGTRVKK